MAAIGRVGREMGTTTRWVPPSPVRRGRVGEGAPASTFVIIAILSLPNDRLHATLYQVRLCVASHSGAKFFLQPWIAGHLPCRLYSSCSVPTVNDAASRLRAT